MIPDYKLDPPDLPDPVAERERLLEAIDLETDSFQANILEKLLDNPIAVFWVSKAQKAYHTEEWLKDNLVLEQITEDGWDRIINLAALEILRRRQA